MKVFITGANGFIGTHLTERLFNEGHDVTVLVRNQANAGWFVKKGIKVTGGDLFSIDKLICGMEGCDWVFHLAAYTKPTSLDKDLPYKTNVEGTVNVLDAAGKMGVKKVVVTSTAGTMGYSFDGRPVNEETNKDPEYHTDYERTKFQAEKIAAGYSGEMDVITVNPSRVFGPGILSKSNSITLIMKLYGQGIWRIIPGDGTAIGNYAFIDDVINGHILAAVNGKSGERYILGGENVSFDRLFETLGKAFGNRRKMFNISKKGLHRLAIFTGIFTSLAGKPPLISENWIDKYLRNWILSNNKAIEDLSYTITPFEEGVEKTVFWLKSGETKNE